jgi:hypothetical protein
LFLALTVLIGAPTAALALSSGTSWLVVPGHLLFSLVAVVAALSALVEGRPGRARTIGLLYLGFSVAAAAALGWGAEMRGERWSWVLPWVAMLAWGWVPPVVSAVSAWGAAARARSVRRAVVRNRKAALLAKRQAEPSV